VDLNPEGAKDLAYDLGKGTNMFLVLATADEDKPMLSCYISKELVADKIKCRASSRELGKYIQGGGGGQPLLLQEEKCRRYSRGIKQAVEFVK
jgi:alanyl-tRNA synthetase